MADLATQIVATPGEVSGTCQLCGQVVLLYLDLAETPRVERHGYGRGACAGGGMTPVGVRDPWMVGPTWGYFTRGERGDGG